MNHRLFVVLVLAGSALLAGCGDNKVEVVPVSGTVKINGEPLEGIGVAFQPMHSGQKATDASGVTDESGRYELSVPVTGQKGVMAGEYRVRFTAGNYPTVSEDGAPQVYEPIPPKYNLDSQEMFQVPPEGSDSADFNLDIPGFKRTP